MRKLTEDETESIVSLLKEGKPLPEGYKNILFDSKREYELTYAGKEREEDILADTMAVPLQRVKTFRNGKESYDWVNMLIFGDNLQVMKTLLQMKNDGKLCNADGTPGIRLVYIDPPFATRQEFAGSRDQKAYQDKIIGVEFLDFLRSRLIFIRELVSENGHIFVHVDYRKGHYIKALLDEILGEENFRNEIILPGRASKNLQQQFEQISRLNVRHDNLFWYSATSGSKVSPLWVEKHNKGNPEGHWHHFWSTANRPTMRYKLFGIKPDTGQWTWEKERTKKAVDNYDRFLEEGGGRTLAEYWRDTGGTLEFVRKNPDDGSPQYWRAPAEERLADTLWSGVPVYSNSTKYPTEKSERLLHQIVSFVAAPGDIVMDVFAGSGTTPTVAEKLGCRWIGCDCGKLAIYTMQKRILNLAESKDLVKNNRKYGKSPKPFTLFNAGLYDYKMIRELPWGEYRGFALQLFQCRDEKHEISKVELDGYLAADSVMVFNYQKHKNAVLDRGFVEDLHKYLGDRIGRRFFIIAPAASVQFIEDYIEKGKTKYFILRIPYSIIEEIHSRGFAKLKQPVNETEVNDTVNAVGFDFIQMPTVECKYFLQKPKNVDLLNHNKKECVIKIVKFQSKVISRQPQEFKNLKTLSMVMLDYDFDGTVFDLDEVFYAEHLRNNGYEIRFAKDKVKRDIMIIYIDTFGNEKREVKTLSGFTSKSTR